MAGSEAGHGEYFSSRDCASIIATSLSPLRIRPPPSRRPHRFLLQRHMRSHPGDHGIAAVDKARDHGAAHPALGTVEAVDAAVAVAGLSPAVFLKCNPRPDFRTHSNLMNCHPLPLSGAEQSLQNGL
jgi:hypothetical protein